MVRSVNNCTWNNLFLLSTYYYSKKASSWKSSMSVWERAREFQVDNFDNSQHWHSQGPWWISMPQFEFEGTPLKLIGNHNVIEIRRNDTWRARETLITSIICKYLRVQYSWGRLSQWNWRLIQFKVVEMRVHPTKTRTSRPKRKVNRLYMEKRERPKGERGTAITRRKHCVNTPYYSIMIIVIFRAKFVATRTGRLRTGDDRWSKIHRVCFESTFQLEC